MSSYMHPLESLSSIRGYKRSEDDYEWNERDD